MGNKRRREDFSSESLSESSSDSDDMLVPSCSREACQRRFPDQELRDRRRRRKLVCRRQKRRYTNAECDSTSSEDGKTEGSVERRRRRFKNSRPAASAPEPEPGRAVEEDKKWFTFSWHDIIFSVLAVILVILFLETFVVTWVYGRPPYRFTSYLCCIVVCCVLWYFFMMPKKEN